jgi:hypothetical protein
MKGKELGSQDAFPSINGGSPHVQEGGLTKREHFAGLAMQGLLSTDYTGDSETYHRWITTSAVALADALLEELAKGS